MGSLVKTYKKEKLEGKIYTPPAIVKKILSETGYNQSTFQGKKILDPACGDGKFLIEVVKLIIKHSDKSTLKENLLNVYGWDMDETSVKECRKKLDKLVKNERIDWNITVFNPILAYDGQQVSVEPTFDYIVGNPPYIRIQHLDEELRKHIQKNFKFCRKGAIDIYVAFFELVFKYLNESGACGFITPNTFFYTETARELRNYLADNHTLKKIINYKESQLFEDATTYSAITILTKAKTSSFVYEERLKKTHKSRDIDYSEILHKKFWQLSSKPPVHKEGVRLQDICDIHVGITTLCDKAYIFKTEKIDDTLVYAHTRLKGKVKLEKQILKPIVKGSTLKDNHDFNKESLLFPYIQVEGKHKIIPEHELKKDYPYAYKYLKSIKSILDKRDNGKPNKTAWYALGRHQALDTGFGKKIIFAPMNKKPNFIYWDKPAYTVYSGYFIKYEGDCEKLCKQLNSKEMEHFISISSRDFRDGWKAYNKSILKNYIVDPKQL